MPNGSVVIDPADNVGMAFAAVIDSKSACRQSD
jgi:hypothetical protein